MPETRLIVNYGHVCTLPAEKDNRSLLTRSVEAFRIFFVINELNPRAFKYCRSQFEFRQEKKKHLKNFKFVIHPFSTFRICWEIFMILISLFSLFFSPYITTFTLFPHISLMPPWKTNLILSLDLICLLDIILNFRTGFYDSRRLINLKTCKVIKNYVKTYFFLDLLSSLYPVYYAILTSTFIKQSDIEFVLNLIVTGLKLFRLFPCMKYLHSTCEVLGWKNYKCKLTLMIVCSLVVTHWITCVCILVSTLSVGLFSSDTPLHQSWIARDDLWNSSQLMIYATGLMRTACIVSNAEYEANESQTTEDQLVMCILWILTRVLKTLIISFLIQITRSIISSQTKYKEMVLQLKQYMHHKQLSAYTQNRLINYYEFRFQKRFFRDEEILSMISGHLRQEIRRHKCQKLVENVPFFQELPQFLLIRIISCLQLEIFLTNDVIVKSKTRGSSMFFIASGTVAVYSDTGRELYHRHDGQHFGENGLVRPDMLRIATVVATEPCELYRLDRKDYVSIIRPFPELLENIEQRATELLHDITAIDDKYRQCHIDKNKNKPNII